MCNFIKQPFPRALIPPTSPQHTDLEVIPKTVRFWFHVFIT